MAEWTHPRRAAKETISYLSQVEPVIDKFAQDDHSYGGGDEEEDEDVGREQMMDNILEELKHQTASIMEDRQGSVVAEKIVRRLTPLQLRVMLSRCGGYMLSLANNRYSSHVLQTLLSVAGSVIEAEVSGDDTYRREEPTTATAGDTQEVGLMQDVVISLVSELSGTWAELLADVSGSHVGRGFLQVLGGLPILTEKRGRQSRHSHSIGTAVGPGGRGHSSSAGGAGHPSSAPEGKGKGHTAVDPEALEKWSTPFKYPVPRSFEAALGSVTSELAALPAGELQALACGTFGCPTMVMLLRVHGNLAVDPASGRLPALEQGSDAMKLVMKTLEWENEERSVQVVYAISGENTASHFLEAVLWLSPRGFFQELYHRCFESKLLEFCEHGVSNFLIQAALQRAEDKALAETMVAALGENASDLLKSRRAGVLWRAAQACVRLSLSPKTQTKLLEDIARAVQAGHTGAPPPPPSTGDDNVVTADPKGGDGGVTSPSVDAFRAAREWVPALLSPRLPGEGGLDRLFLNVPGARIVQNTLLFEPPVAAPVLKAVAALPEAVLAAVARDNMGSRCLLDPILEAAAAGKGGGGRGKNRPAEDARRSILRAFRGHLVAMACDRVAWHILLKCFRGVDMKEKRVMAEELAGAGEQAHSRMSGYPSGRSVLTECMVERFSRSPHEWEDAFKNRDNRSKMLTEILAVESAAKSGKGGKGQGGKKEGKGETATNKRGGVTLAPSPFSAQEAADGGDEGDAEGGGNGKDKRRRQRGRGKRGKSSKGGDGTGEEGANAADQSGDALEARRNATEGETPAETGGRGSETRKHAAENGSGQGEKSSRTVAKEVSVVGGTEPVPKKKKRRRQEGQLEGGGVEGEDAAGEEAADLSLVIDAVKQSKSAEGQAAVATGKKDKKDKKDKKNNKKKSSSASDSVGIDGGTDAAPREAKVKEAPATVVADSTATDSAAKKKKRRKVEVEAKAVAVDSVSERSTGGLAKQEAGDGGAGAEPKTAPGSEKGSEKKRKKTSSGGGFRLF